MSNRNQSLKPIGKGATATNKGANKGVTAKTNEPKLTDPSEEVVITQTLKDEEVVVTASNEEVVVTATENTETDVTVGDNEPTDDTPSTDDEVKTDETVLENPSDPTDLNVKKDDEAPKTEPTEIVPEVVIIKTEEYVPKQPSGDVKIRIKEDHNCCYGNRNFYMKKGQYYNVPPHLKVALAKADLLLPL